MTIGKISYEPLFQTMKEKNVTTYKLFKKMGFSDRTYYRIKNGESIKTDTIAKLCDLLECEVQDIIQYVKPDKKEED